MKKILLLMVMVYATHQLQAQDPPTFNTGHDNTQDETKMKKFRSMFYLLIAGNLSTLTSGSSEGEYDPEYDPAIGFQIGGFARLLSFSKDFHLGAGIAYSQQGAKSKSTDYEPGGDYGETTTTTRLNYLNLPIMAEYQKEGGGFYAQAGIQPGFLLSAKVKGDETTDIKENLNGFDFGIPVGFGYRFKNNIGVGARVTPGLKNIHKENDYMDNKNMVFSLSAFIVL